MNTKQEITIKDLAQMTGYSIATVSRSLNNSPLVKEETKRKVLALADKYHFELNASAKGLATSKVNTIGVILPPEYDRFGQQLYYSSLVNDLRGTLERANYDLIVTFSANRFTGKSNIISLINQKKVDGLIILREVLQHKIMDFLEKKNVPYIFSHYHPVSEDFSFDAVYPDHFWGGKVAGEYLASIGCRQILCISVQDKDTQFLLRERGFGKSLEASGIAFSERNILRTSQSIEDGYRVVMEHADRFPQIDGMFVMTDLIAIGAISALKELGLHIPRDISVIGYDDVPLASMLRPTLTTIHQPREEIAQKTCKRLIDRIQRGERSLAKIRETIRPYLIVRESSKASTEKNQQVLFFS